MSPISCQKNGQVLTTYFAVLMATCGFMGVSLAEAACAVGDSVQALHAGTGGYHSAVILSMNQDDTMTVNWDDGDLMHRTVEVDHVRRGSTPCAHDNSFTIPVKRTRVPIKRKGQIVSHKTTYSGKITVGSPLQHFSVVFDTGSGHVVLPSTKCTSKACTIHRRYNRSLSSGAVDINIDKSVMVRGQPYDEITVKYGTGQIVGTLVDEDVCVGRVCTRMGMIQATELSHNPFAFFPVDGIFGMGLGSLALNPDFSFFGVARRNGDVKVAQFALYFDEDDDEGSELTVGGFNRARMQSPVTWVPVANPEMGHWQVNLKAVHIGDQTLDICKDGSCKAILDTGTSHLGLPSRMEKMVEDLLSTPAQQSDNCLLSQSKPITFELENFNLTLNTENYMRRLPLDDRIIKPTNSIPLAEANTTSDANKTSLDSNLISTDADAEKVFIWCRPLLLPVNLPEPFGSKLFVLGEPVLRKYYTVFDASPPTLGFGLAKAEANEPVQEDAIIFMQQGVQQSGSRQTGDDTYFVQVTIVSVKRTTAKESVGTRVTIL